MARDFNIDGEVMVSVKGGAHMSGAPIATLSQLGLSVKEVSILPRFKYRDINVDDFGPDIPAEVMWMLADVQITMGLIHTDIFVLDTCIGEAMGGSVPGANVGVFAGTLGPVAGTLAGAGSLMGNGLPPLASGNHFISLNLASPVLNLPWHFPTAYLDSMPLEWPMGTETSKYKLSWRAIPYAWPQKQAVLTTPSVSFQGLLEGNSIVANSGVNFLNTLTAGMVVTGPGLPNAGAAISYVKPGYLFFSTTYGAVFQNPQNYNAVGPSTSTASYSEIISAYSPLWDHEPDVN